MTYFFLFLSIFMLKATFFTLCNVDFYTKERVITCNTYL